MKKLTADKKFSTVYVFLFFVVYPANIHSAFQVPDAYLRLGVPFSL
jgi:hypothetical protein